MTDFVSNTLEGMPLRFDYSRITPENILHVKRRANEVRTLFQNRGTKVYGSDIFPIGAILLDVRKRMSQPLFYIWLETEAQIPKATAWTYIKIVRKFGTKSSKLQNLTVTALYELTLPSFPQGFLEKVLSGEYVPDAQEVKRMRIPQSVDAKSYAVLQEAERTVVFPEAEQQIIDLQDKIQELTENSEITIKELEIALEIVNEALVEKDKEIERLEEDNAKLLKEKNYLLDKCRIDSDKLNRLIMTMKQVCGEN